MHQNLLKAMKSRKQIIHLIIRFTFGCSILLKCWSILSECTNVVHTWQVPARWERLLQGTTPPAASSAPPDPPSSSHPAPWSPWQQTLVDNHCWHVANSVYDATSDVLYNLSTDQGSNRYKNMNTWRKITTVISLGLQNDVYNC